jgi:hypothetical protein
LGLLVAEAPEKVTVLVLAAAQGQVDHYQCSVDFAAFELCQESQGAAPLGTVCTPWLTLPLNVQLQGASLLWDQPLTGQHERLHLCDEPNTEFALDCGPYTQEAML